VDEYAASRLPDLPNAGYSSPKQKATSDLVMFWLRNIERDRVLLLRIVVDGPHWWRKIAGDAWGLNRGGRVSAMSTDLLDRVFQYMELLAGPNPAQQLLILLHQQQVTTDFRASTRETANTRLRMAMADLRKR
jgi:hypothetical protein